MRLTSDPDRQVELFTEFLDHYERSETKPAVVAFLRALGGTPKEKQ